MRTYVFLLHQESFDMILINNPSFYDGGVIGPPGPRARQAPGTLSVHCASARREAAEMEMVVMRSPWPAHFSSRRRQMPPPLRPCRVTLRYRQGRVSHLQSSHLSETRKGRDRTEFLSRNTNSRLDRFYVGPKFSDRKNLQPKEA
jgi:hypothetical protein